MYNLVARIPDGLGQLRTLLENHITSQGLNALEKCGDQAFNVSKTDKLFFKIVNVDVAEVYLVNFLQIHKILCSVCSGSQGVCGNDT